MFCFTSLPSPEKKFKEKIVIFLKISEMTLFGNSGSSFGSSNPNSSKEHSVQDVPTDTVSSLRFTGANSANGQVL